MFKQYEQNKWITQTEPTKIINRTIEHNTYTSLLAVLPTKKKEYKVWGNLDLY